MTALEAIEFGSEIGSGGCIPSGVYSHLAVVFGATNRVTSSSSPSTLLSSSQPSSFLSSSSAALLSVTADARSQSLRLYVNGVPVDGIRRYFSTALAGVANRSADVDTAVASSVSSNLDLLFRRLMIVHAGNARDVGMGGGGDHNNREPSSFAEASFNMLQSEAAAALAAAANAPNAATGGGGGGGGGSAVGGSPIPAAAVVAAVGGLLGCGGWVGGLKEVRVWGAARSRSQIVSSDGQFLAAAEAAAA